MPRKNHTTIRVVSGTGWTRVSVDTLPGVFPDCFAAFNAAKRAGFRTALVSFVKADGTRIISSVK